MSVRELLVNSRILAPGEIYGARDNPIAPRLMSMFGVIFFVLYILYRQQPTRSLKSYIYWLFFAPG